ncbi:AAA family ATPase [Streptomyces kunmingensis]|uniref:AAA family ATPase n=1 Tax=Streptomyces kunmingensis TaxID=68225 RepID=A0ABU6CK29_9ACTN|nr:BTAD domain-containing putative transcriptional regulator [Streptomyces kunmingensis]MEB3965080.1 AAA family ATPase [Streptomyces kunmingensis]
MGTLRFEILGPLRVTRGEDSGEKGFKPGSPQQQALLVQVLLCAGLGVSMRELVSGVWGDEPPNGAIANLRTYAWRLRRLLEPSPAEPRILVSVGDGYRLDASRCSVDADEAAALSQQAAEACESGQFDKAGNLVEDALGLWRGEPLARVPGPFAERQRERWSELRTVLLEQHYDLALQRGTHRAIVPELTALAAEHPDRERMHALLMRALHADGRRTEALALFQRVRRVLVDEQGMEPGREISEVHARILDDVGGERGDGSGSVSIARTVDHAGRTVSAETASAHLTVPDGAPYRTPSPPGEPSTARGPFPRVVPAQLPRPVPDFVGRADEVETLRTLLSASDRQGPPLAAVSGMGGIGKTSLVLHVAHLARALYPDGQLYVDLRGMDTDPEDPAIVLGAFLDGLGCPLHLLPDTVEARARLLRTLLDGRRVLIVLDNAADAAQVRHLLPGSAGCAVLVTSRSQLPSLEGAVQLGLGRLLPEDAVALVGRIIGSDRLDAERVDVRALVGACGQLPLATRIVSARLAVRPAWPIATMTARLTDEVRRVSELRVGDLAVESAFDLSYRHLPAEQARAFRLIAAATSADVFPRSAAAVLHADEAQAEELLEALVSASMVESPTPGRYRIHDLLRAFGRARARAHDPAEADTAYENLLGYLLATACSAFAQLVPGDSVVSSIVSLGATGERFDDPQGARHWAREHFETAVLAALNCADRADLQPYRRLLPAAADLLVALSPFVGDLRHSQLASVALRVSEAAERHGDQRSFGRARWLSCSFALRAGRLTDAGRHAERAAPASRAVDDIPILRQVLNDLGLISVSLGDFEGAIAHYEKALVLARRLGHRSGEIATSLNAALAHVRLGRTDQALHCAETVLDAIGELDDDGALAYALYVKGVALSGAERHEEALAALTGALQACDRAGDEGRRVHVCHRLSDTLRCLGRLAEAGSMARRAIILARRRGDQRSEAQALLVCGRVSVDRGDPEGARVYGEQALALFERLSLPERREAELLVEAVGGSSH